MKPIVSSQLITRINSERGHEIYEKNRNGYIHCKSMPAMYIL